MITWKKLEERSHDSNLLNHVVTLAKTMSKEQALIQGILIADVIIKAYINLEIKRFQSEMPSLFTQLQDLTDPYQEE
jgi:hypothetical protein